MLFRSGVPSISEGSAFHFGEWRLACQSSGDGDLSIAFSSKQNSIQTQATQTKALSTMSSFGVYGSTFSAQAGRLAIQLSIGAGPSKNSIFYVQYLALFYKQLATTSIAQ